MSVGNFLVQYDIYYNNTDQYIKIFELSFDIMWQAKAKAEAYSNDRLYIYASHHLQMQSLG